MTSPVQLIERPKEPEQHPSPDGPVTGMSAAQLVAQDRLPAKQGKRGSTRGRTVQQKHSPSRAKSNAPSPKVLQLQQTGPLRQGVPRPQAGQDAPSPSPRLHGPRRRSLKRA